MVAHPRSASDGFWFLLKFRLDQIYSFGDSAVLTFWHFGLKRPIHARFRRFWRHISRNDVIRHCSPQKAPPCAETRRLSHEAWRSVQQFDLGATEQGRTVKKVTKAFSYTWDEASTEPICTKICTVVAILDEIMRAKFWTEICRRYGFTGGRISQFSYWFLHGPYNSAALMRCLWYFCSDDKHSDREPKRLGHVCIFLHAVDRCCRSGWHSYVTWQHLWPVRLPCVANKSPALEFSWCINLQHLSHSTRALRGCHPSRLVSQQCKNRISDGSISVFSHCFKYRHRLVYAKYRKCTVYMCPSSSSERRIFISANCDDDKPRSYSQDQILQSGLDLESCVLWYQH